jgi:deoxyhypusine synthase
MSKGPISQFIEKHYLHFNSAALVDAAKGYEEQLANGAKMMVTLAGAMSTAEIGKIFAEMIRQDKVQIISCTCKFRRRYHDLFAQHMKFMI